MHAYLQISDDDKKTLQTTIKETTDWIDNNGSEASADTLEEKLAELQAIVNPITAKLYADGAGGSSGSSGGDDDEHVHDEL